MAPFTRVSALEEKREYLARLLEHVEDGCLASPCADCSALENVLAALDPMLWSGAVYPEHLRSAARGARACAAPSPASALPPARRHPRRSLPSARTGRRTPATPPG